LAGGTIKCNREPDRGIAVSIFQNYGIFVFEKGIANDRTEYLQ